MTWMEFAVREGIVEVAMHWIFTIDY